MSTRLLVHKLAYFLNKFFLSTLGVSVVLRHDLAVAVANDNVRDGLYAERALEVAVRVEQNLILPAVVVYERLHLVAVLCLVDRHGDNLHAGLLLPLLVHLADGGELAVAGLAPCCKEVDDERLAVV